MGNEESRANVWKRGTIEVHIYNEGDLISGTTVNGSVNIQLKDQLFPVTELIVAYRCVERIHGYTYIEQNKEKKYRQSEKEVIRRFRSIATFKDG